MFNFNNPFFYSFSNISIKVLLISSYTISTAWVQNYIEPIMVTIPAGSFEMGSLTRESTQPVHKVDIAKFSMGKFEVTVNEFRQFVELTNYPAPTECQNEMNGWFFI
jgi:formylglycine-generating enzyme required for sulfatase activity